MIIYIALASWVIVFIVGAFVFLSPERIQKIALRYYDKHRTLVRLNPFMSFIASKEYIVMLRFVGLFAIAASIIFTYLTLMVER